MKKINIKYRVTFQDLNKTVIETNDLNSRIMKNFRDTPYTFEEVNHKVEKPDFTKYASLQVEKPLLIIDDQF